VSIRTVFETLELASKTPGRNAKLDLINLLVKDDWNKLLLREVVEYTYNPFWLYRVSPPATAKVPAVDSQLYEADAMWQRFKEMLDRLRTKKVELSVGRRILHEYINLQPPLFEKYLCQILARDIKCGIQSWSKWFPGLLPAEPVMLCEKWEGDKLEGTWIAEPKIDGFRAAVVVDAEGNCEAISRGNKQFWNWQHIADEIKSLGIRDVVLDGEFYAGDFGLTGSICKTQTLHSQASKLKYYIFDMLTTEEWKTLKCQRTLKERKETLFKTLYPLSWEDPNLVRPSCLQLLDPAPITCEKDISTIADEFYKAGFEGTVIKDLSSFYIFDRSRSWLKLKPEEDADLTVTGAEVGQGRHSDRLGALFVKGSVTYKKKQYEITAKVGGGFSDVERDEFWKRYKDGKLEGLVIEVTYQDVTVQNGTTDYSLRFPRFKRIRFDKSPMELE